MAKFFCKLQFGLLLTKSKFTFHEMEDFMLEIEVKSFYLQFKSSFPNPQSKSHHKIVLLFKYRDKWFHKLLHGGNLTTGIGYQQKSLLSHIFILSNCSWPSFLRLGKLALLIGTSGCACWHKSGSKIINYPLFYSLSLSSRQLVNCWCWSIPENQYLLLAAQFME